MLSKTRDELERNFVEGFERLARANAAFDKGHLSEAPDIAKEVLNFVFDRGANRSILSHLGMKQGFAFLTTTVRADTGLPAGAILASPDYRLLDAMIGFDGMGYRPYLGRKPSRMTDFNSWWNEPVLAWPGREDIARSELVEFLRHTEGGGHVSGSFERRWAKKMAALIRGEWVDGHMEFGDGQPVAPEPQAPAYATMRQIGWEIEEALRRNCPQLTRRASFAPGTAPRMRRITPA